MRDSSSEAYRDRMTRPCFKPGETARLRLTDRLQLFIVAWIFLLAAPVIVAADYLAKKLFGSQLPASLATVVSYVSAVKLYSQARRHGAGMLASVAEQPRFTIRRRMVEAIAGVATLDYDRWYVFAHSQGTVVAFNGLMTHGDIMANYLNDHALNRLGKAAPNLSPTVAAELAADGKLMPPLPPRRLHNPRTIDRSALFAKFHGLLTYGSPLDKFAGIWPPTVAMASEPAVFRPRARWLNVWDPTDPVSAELNAFDPRCILEPGQPSTGCLKPENHPVAGGPFLLASHLGYLAGGTGAPKPLTSLLGEWLLNDTPPNIAPLRIRNVRLRRGWALLQVLLLVAILVTAWTLIGKALAPLAGWIVGLPNAASAQDTGSQDLLTRAWAVLSDALVLAPQAALLSLGLVIILGLIGRFTTVLDPADERRSGGKAGIYILNQIEGAVEHRRAPGSTAQPPYGRLQHEASNDQQR